MLKMEKKFVIVTTPLSSREKLKVGRETEKKKVERGAEGEREKRKDIALWVEII